MRIYLFPLSSAFSWIYFELKLPNSTGGAGGIAYALHGSHPNNPQPPFQLYCS
jgi:hypothetical protein